ncbi:MAG: HNH endonuclease [Ruminiclostridium sp.]|nr:HNH endonuclease [Ruminiclostridium sp.]
MGRVPINPNVQRRLYAESMGKCMNPNCLKDLFDSNGDIIEKAHIDPYCKTADNTFENLVVLCPNCHTNFDKNKAFTPEEVLHWKEIRKQDIKRFFSKHYSSFNELKKNVKPLLMANKTIYEK